ncbi:MAG TPA: phosphoribosyltransferase family protein [Coriobacteriia bacterium]|jgi:putative phosphoribosyl transferase
MFLDRAEAGRQLAQRLARFTSDPSAIVLGIPRGGVVVAAEVARELHLPLDVVVVRKIGAPGNPEYAVGAMDEDGRVVRSGVHASEEYLARAVAENRAEIERRVREYRGGRSELPVRGKVALLVDDGIATGLTALAAIGYLRAHEAARVVLATPVIARTSAEELAGDVDELVAVSKPATFYAVGQFYDRFDQTSDDEVRKLLAVPGRTGM